MNRELEFDITIKRLESIIKTYQIMDSSKLSMAGMREEAESLRPLIKAGQDAIAMATERLNVLSEVVNHLDSIMESLLMASDKDCVSMLAFAVEEVAGRDPLVTQQGGKVETQNENS